jgi:peptidoglycan hydrolase-like protein with peptidoglycan-binding domain
MSLISSLLQLLGLSGGETGLVLDTIGQPVGSVDVELRNPAGDVLETARTAADGTFAFTRGVTCPTVYDLIIDTPGIAARFRLTNPIGFVPLVVRRPVTLSRSIGITGDNVPIDLRRVQDLLQHLGRLTDADVAAEPIDPTSAVALAAADLPLLMTALYNHLRAVAGETPMQVDAGSRYLRLLNFPQVIPPLAPAFYNLVTSVGEAPGQDAVAPALNAPPDVRRVQDRLLQMGFITPQFFRAERANPAAGANIGVAALAETIQSIRAFNTAVVGSAQHAVFEREAQERLLRDPYCWGRLSLTLQFSVGEGGTNQPPDVRALQERLNEAGILSDANFAAERVAIPTAGAPSPPVAVNTLAETLAAIETAHVNLLGVAAPAPRWITPEDPAVTALSMPPPVEIFQVGDEQPPVMRPAQSNRMNHPRHVRAVQERLRLLMFLADVDFLLERVNPSALTSVPAGDIGATLAAIRAAQEALGIPTPGLHPVVGGEMLLPAHRPAQFVLAGAVGQGAPNNPADVNAIQARLIALGFLNPLPPPTQAATFAAISAMRRRIFGLPLPTGDPWTAQPIIEPQSDTLAFLNDPLFFSRPTLRIDGSMGEFGANRVADVTAVQDRLKALRLLSDAHHAAETPAAGQLQRVREDEIPNTIAAIRTLRREFLGEDPDVGRLEAAHPVIVALNRPFRELRMSLAVTGSIGTAGDNAPADVRLVQRRMRDLGVLSSSDYVTEAPLVANPVDFAVLPGTLASLNEWRTNNEGVDPANPPIDRFSLSKRRLEWPALPKTAPLPAAGVGAYPPPLAGRNQQADVLLVQNRLHELGLLSTREYLRERRVAQGLPAVAAAQMPATVDAIRLFQHTASGGTDGRIDLGGSTARTLHDPMFGTPTPTNPDTANRRTGPGMPAAYHADPARHREIVAIIAAIEMHEAGGSTGEVPAILRNGSSTPASFGKAQVIGATAIGTLQNDAGTAGFYGLNAAALVALQALVAAVVDRYDAIFVLVPAPGMTEANLVAAFSAYQGANAAAFTADTRLGPRDIVRMFRTAQFRRQTAAFIAAQPGANDAARRAAAVAAVAVFSAQADVAPNMADLGIGRTDAASFLRSAIHAEHLAGFVARALLHAEQRLLVKSALTDDSGFKLGRFVIRDNFVQVLNQAGGPGLTRRQRAEITVRIHNSGPAGVAGFVAAPATAVNAYVNNVMPHWVDPGP